MQILEQCHIEGQSVLKCIVTGGETSIHHYDLKGNVKACSENVPTPS